MRILGVTALLFATSMSAANLHIVQAVSPTIVAVFEPGATVTYSIHVANEGNDVAQQPVFTMPLPPGSRFISTNAIATDFNCTADGGIVTCRAVLLGARATNQVVFDITAPPAGGRYITHATLTSSSPESFPPDNELNLVLNVYRTFTVTTTADSGAGSLRQALLDVNGVCLDSATCRVFFDLGAPIATIAPVTPLPAITACRVTIDAGTKDANPDFIFPRRVALSGGDLEEGNGLVVSSSCAEPGTGGVTINGLAIHSFPENGILVSESAERVSITRDFIGLDPTGTIGMGNRLRGVAAFTSGRVGVFRSNISGNGRSGVYFWSATNPEVSQSRLFHNGACGIFSRVGQLYVSDNEIARNDGFGIAVARGAKQVVINRNLIYENVAIGIDRGLDSLSINDPLIPNAPVISDATYDAKSNATFITLRIDLTPEQAKEFGSFPVVQVFASTKVDGWGRSDADRLIADEFIAPGGTAVIRVAGDFRGQTITAMANLRHIADDLYADATEISNGVVSH